MWSKRMNFLKIRTLYIELTHACNQHCKHCYLNGGTHHVVAEMSTEQVKKILREFKEIACFTRRI